MALYIQQHHQTRSETLSHSAFQTGAINITVLIAAAAAVLLLAGGAFWFINQSNNDKMADSGIVIATVPPQFVVFKDIIVNLLPDETEEMHFMQMDIALMTRSSPTQKTIESNIPVIRNAILDLLATWTFDEIQKPENRNVLRHQVLNALTRLPSLPNIQGIESVLITNMIVQ